MNSDSARPVWPLVVIAVAAIAIYLYTSIEVRRPEVADAPPRGGRAEVEGLADRDDINILFVLIDTLRAERMSAYGYERETTPFLDRLAKTGIRFSHHISQSSWTKSSMASLWTSLNPLRSGVTKFNHSISPDIRMPAEVLKDAGFKTVGLYRNGWVHGYFGFDQGFEKYYRPHGVRRRSEVWQNSPNAESRGSDEELITDAIEFLRIHGDTSRWFLYLHLMDLHEYTYDEESAIFGNTVSDLYDNSLLRTDWVVSRIHEYLDERDLLKKTMIVVLSDHGEAFGERGFEGHARTVFPETTETPLLISLPFELDQPLIVSSRTANVDVWPTLLDLLGLLEDDERDGVSRRSEILAAAEGGDQGAEGDGDLAVAFLDENWGKPGTGLKAAISVLEGPYRYVAGTDFSGFDFEVLLSTDETVAGDLMLEQPEVAERLRAAAQEQLEKTALFEAGTYELDEMQLDQLRALGYKLP
jgi:arylsulfatase A-like enzyme